MNLLISVLLIVLWSSISILPFANAKVKSNTSTPIQAEAFTIEKNLVHIDKKNSQEVENMPAIWSQDTVGSCFGCASSTIVQKFLCDSDDELKGIPCNSTPRNKTISQFGLVAWADTNEKRISANRSENGLVDTKDPGNHTNLRLYHERSKFSSGSNALRDSVDAFEFMPESCFPFDQLVSKYGSKDSSLFKKAFERTQALYTRMKSKTEGESLHCEDCLKQLKTDFNTNKFSSESFASAMSKESFSEFLHELIFYKCEPITSNKRPIYKQFPPGKGETADKNLVLEKIKEIINKKKPLLISSICLEYEAGGKTCKNSHDTVVSGYRRACPTEDLTSPNCKNQIKLHNCWGQDWQDSNNDGWVDADLLIKNMNEGKTYIDSGDLSWLE